MMEEERLTQKRAVKRERGETVKKRGRKEERMIEAETESDQWREDQCWISRPPC